VPLRVFSRIEAVTSGEVRANDDRAGRLGASGCRSSDDEKTLARASIEMSA
jgi:hypothetical protein